MNVVLPQAPIRYDAEDQAQLRNALQRAFQAVPVTPAIKGYGTPTGAVRLANFPGATATLAQTSAMVAQIILDLQNAKRFAP